MNKRLIILLILFLAIFSVLVNKSFVKYVYVSPKTNTKVLQPLTKTIKPVDNILNRVMSYCQKDFKNMKYVYKNYYGSGFLKYNNIPNDLDASVGVDLGYYETDGTNIDKIAKELSEKIIAYHVYIYTCFSTSKKPEYVLDDNLMKKIFEYQNKQKESEQYIKKGLEHVVKNEKQVLKFNKKYREKDVDYTFILNNDEVYINELQPVFAYTKGMKYNKNMLDYPREITIIPDFYATIKNTKTNKVKHIDLIEESFLGERFQISRRFFVPLVFTGNDSLKFLKSRDYLNDDKQYVDTRMFNYFRYIDEIQLYIEYSIDPVKLLKRLHQCTDIISPLLTQEEENKIYSDIDKALGNNSVKLANEYLNLIKNLNMLSVNSFVIKRAGEVGYIQDILMKMNMVTNQLEQENIPKDKIDKLKTFNYEIEMMIRGLNSQKTFDELKKFYDDNQEKISIVLAQIVNDNIKDTNEFVKDYKLLKNIYITAGFHKIDIHQIDLKTIYIVKNDFTKKLSKNDLKALAKENNMPDANYVLVDEKSVPQTSRSEIKYVRYKSTDAENKAWQEYQNKLLKDKSNYRIKRRYIF